jgi:5,10-methenyltetrahydrofolate synthetase
MSLTPELARWRKAERQTLIARRMAAPADTRAEWGARIEAQVREAFPVLAGMTIGFYWPFQAEFDPRPLITDLIAAGARAALPVVVAKATPLEFREWYPGVTLAPDAFGLSVPVGTPVLVPDAVLVPPVGIGAVGDRLGYGGGFFDRTLASLAPKPLSIAVAFELSRIPTTHPQAHDVLMDYVVTEARIEAAVAGGLETVDVAECRRRAATLVHERGLPRGDARPV